MTKLPKTTSSAKTPTRGSKDFRSNLRTPKLSIKSQVKSDLRREFKDANETRELFETIEDIVRGEKPNSIAMISDALERRGLYLTPYKIKVLLEQLNIVKCSDEDGKIYYQFNSNYILEDTDNLIPNFVTSVVHNNSVIVIKTVIAGAPLVAKIIDYNSHILGVMGTVAGDDTVLVIPRRAEHCEEVFDAIYEFVFKFDRNRD